MKKFISIFLGLVFIFGIFSVVSSQESAKDEFTLEEITVTAEKRTENLQKTSLGITSLTGDALIEKNAISITDVLKDVPNTQVTPTGGGQGYQIIIRGVGSTLPAGTGEAAVSYNVDGNSDSRAESGIFGYFDLENIEVVLGPQGTLYGRNATGGVINVNTASPNTKQIEGYSVFEIGSNNLLREEGAINLPLGDKFATRLAFSNINRKGFMTNGGGDEVGTAVRGKFGYYPSDDVSAILVASNTQMGGVGSNTAVSLADWKAGNYYTCTETKPYNKFDRGNSKYNLNVTINNAGPGVIQFLPSYSIFKTRGWSLSNQTGLMTRENSDEEQKQTELRYSARADAKVQWVSGLYYYDRSQSNAGTATAPYPTSSEAESKAVFGQITYPFTDAFRVLTGGRWSDETVYGDNKNSGINDLTLSFGGFDWKLGLEADIAKDVMTYFTLSTGRRPGGINSMYVPESGVTTFGEEKLISAEVGIKSRFMDNRLQLNGSAFWYDYKDYQVIDGYMDEDGDINVWFFNVDKVKSYGAELEATALICTATMVNMTISYLHNRYAAPCPMHEKIYLPVVDLNGKQLSNAPDWGVKAGIEHSFFLNRGGTLKPNISGRWTDHQYVGIFPSNDSFQDAYAVFDANLLYSSVSDKWNLNFWVKNAMDKIYKTGFNQDYVLVAEPRMFGATINIKF